jgi:cell division protein FtsZ
MADQVLHSGVRSITDLMVLPGLINLDFADVRAVMTEMGKAMMGTGEGSGDGRALTAAENAIQNPLLDEVSLKGAKAVLVNITGGLDMTLLEVDEAANAITNQVDPEANIIFGAAFDPSLAGMIRVSVVATGMDGSAIQAIEPHIRRTEVRAAQPAPAPAPAWQPPEGEPVPVAATSYAPTPEPVVESRRFEPLRAAAYPTAEPIAAAPEPEPAPVLEPVIEMQQPDLPLEPEFEPLPEVQLVEVERPQAVTKIVDPSVDGGDDESMLFPPMHLADENRNRRSGGFLGLFGRQRYQAEPAPQPRASAPVTTLPAKDDEPEDDLEIPSFLRRLAN